jgi:prevent-host-death family protein
MAKTYSIYEAKARFSEILRQVREGKTVTVSYHGRPVAEIRPLGATHTLEERLDELERKGVLVRQPGRRRLRAVAKRPGALREFLEDRGE